MRPYLLIIILMISAIGSYISFHFSSAATPAVYTGQTPSIRSKSGVEAWSPLSLAVFSQQAAAASTTPAQAVDEGRPLAARVNGQPIYLDVYEKQISELERVWRATYPNLDLTSDKGQVELRQIHRQALDGLVDQLIIEQQAQQLNIHITETELQTKADEAIAQISAQTQFERWLAINNLTRQTFMTSLRAQLLAGRLFEAITQDIPQTAEQIQLRYIRVADQAAAQTVAAELERGADFNSVANNQPPAQTARLDTGNLGWLPRQTGLIPAEVEAVAFALNPGEISGPIQTADGFYIIKLEYREAQRPLTDNMLHILKKQIFSEWLQERRNAATIEWYMAL